MCTIVISNFRCAEFAGFVNAGRYFLTLKTMDRSPHTLVTARDSVRQLLCWGALNRGTVCTVTQTVVYMRRWPVAQGSAEQAQGSVKQVQGA